MGYRVEQEIKYCSIEPTNACNLRCKVCFSQNPSIRPVRPRGYMSKEHFKRVLQELASLNFSDMVVSLSYAGESLLHPDFEWMAHEASKAGFKRLQLATNGTLLTNHNIEVLASCFDELAVSFHKSQWLTQVMVKSKKLYYQVKKKDCVMRINVVAQEFSKRELGKMRRIMMGHYDRFKVFPMVTEECRATGPMFPKQDSCPMWWFYLAVMWNGDTLPCCHILSPGGWSMGNVFKTSIQQVFSGQIVEELRRKELAGTPCEKCNIYL